jgi:hypothetical protein
MFDAAREGDAELLLAAIDAGLPPNLTNPKGTFSSVTSHTSFHIVPHATQTQTISNHIMFFLKENRQAIRF